MSSVRFWLSCHEVEEMPNGHWSYQLLFLSRFRVAKGATVHYSDEHSHRIHTLSDTLCLAARKLLSLYTLQAELAPVRSTVFLACNPSVWPKSSSLYRASKAASSTHKTPGCLHGFYKVLPYDMDRLFAQQLAAALELMELAQCHVGLS